MMAKAQKSEFLAAGFNFAHSCSSGNPIPEKRKLGASVCGAVATRSRQQSRNKSKRTRTSEAGAVTVSKIGAKIVMPMHKTKVRNLCAPNMLSTFCRVRFVVPKCPFWKATFLELLV